MDAIIRLSLASLLSTLFVLISPAVSFAGNAALAGKPDQIERRLKSVNSLLNTSSVAKQIKSSKNAKAKNLRQKALKFHEQANKAFKAGDYDSAVSNLVKAKRTMFEGVKATNFSKSSGKKKRRDFQHRLKTVKVLLEAHKRTIAERNIDRSGVIGKVDGLLEIANDLVNAGKLDKGREKLDEAYAEITGSISKMRKGETKARLLIFDTKKDEYIFLRRYNDDYIKLVHGFIKDLKKNSAPKKLISKLTGYNKKGRKLREKAEKLSESGEDEKAIEVIESSTREFKKALRALGFPISY